MLNNKGQTLIELVVSIAIMVIVIGALTFATIAAIRNAQLSKNQVQATKLAQEGIEIIKGIRDRDEAISYPDQAITRFSDLFPVSFSCGIIPLTCPSNPQSCPSDGENNCYFYINSSVLQNATPVNFEQKGIFKRQFFIEDYAQQQKKLTVIVHWIDFAGSHESRLSTILRKL